MAPLFFNKRIVNAWPDSFREIVFAAAREATRQQRIFAEQEDVVCREALAAEGCKVVELTAGERKEFQQATTAEVSITRSQFSDELIELFERDLASVDTA